MADPSFRIGGDVRAVECPERSRECAAAGIGLAAMRAIGVAVGTIGGGGEIGAAGDQVRIGGVSRRRQQNGSSSEDPYCSFSRNVSWQPPQPFFPRSPKAVSIFALSPLFTATRSASAFSAAVFCASRNLFQSVQIIGLVAYFPSELVPPVPGGNTSAIFFVDWAKPAAPASACANSPLPSI